MSHKSVILFKHSLRRTLVLKNTNEQCTTNNEQQRPLHEFVDAPLCTYV
jgi:hypothetical protein